MHTPAAAIKRWIKHNYTTKHTWKLDTFWPITVIATLPTNIAVLPSYDLFQVLIPRIPTINKQL